MSSPHTITMTFDMTDEEGRCAFENARQGLDRGLVLREILEEMRKHLKYENENQTKGFNLATQHWRKRIWDMMEERSVTELE